MTFAERLPNFAAIVGVVELIVVHSFGESGEAWVAENFLAREKYFCNYEDGRFGWVFKNSIAFDEPILRARLTELGRTSSRNSPRSFSPARLSSVNPARQPVK